VTARDAITGSEGQLSARFASCMHHSGQPSAQLDQTHHRGHRILLQSPREPQRPNPKWAGTEAAQRSQRKEANRRTHSSAQSGLDLGRDFSPGPAPGLLKSLWQRHVSINARATCLLFRLLCASSVPSVPLWFSGGIVQNAGHREHRGGSEAHREGILSPCRPFRIRAMLDILHSLMRLRAEGARTKVSTPPASAPRQSRRWPSIRDLSQS